VYPRELKPREDVKRILSPRENGGVFTVDTVGAERDGRHPRRIAVLPMVDRASPARRQPDELATGGAAPDEVRGFPPPVLAGVVFAGDNAAELS
jgi:hypothetical protein